MLPFSISRRRRTISDISALSGFHHRTTVVFSRWWTETMVTSTCGHESYRGPSFGKLDSVARRWRPAALCLRGDGRTVSR